MAAKRRKIINYRQLKVAEIWERNPKQNLADIRDTLASEFGISVHLATVSRDVVALEQRNLKRSNAVVDAVKQQLAEEYEFIYSEVIAAWYKSLEAKQVITAENVEAEGGKAASRIKASERTEGQSGNPALMAQAQAALKAVRELYGLDDRQDIVIKLEQELSKTLDVLQTILKPDVYAEVLNAITNLGQAGETTSADTQ